MVKLKDSIDFYWDPVCPWCWITSRWMIDVGRQRRIQVNWKLFSLKKINEGRNIPEHFRILHEMGL
ncbi:MAG: DsbA family protein, partial [Deltaproteobacteria bacterium]|nr:DsbA family protein [Deltaproteobacteria bacterium]